MEIEVKGFKGILLELESVFTNIQNRVVYYRIKIYDFDKKVTIILDNVYPEEIEIIREKEE